MREDDPGLVEPTLWQMTQSVGLGEHSISHDQRPFPSCMGLLIESALCG